MREGREDTDRVQRRRRRRLRGSRRASSGRCWSRSSPSMQEKTMSLERGGMAAELSFFLSPSSFAVVPRYAPHKGRKMDGHLRCHSFLPSFCLPFCPAPMHGSQLAWPKPPNHSHYDTKAHLRLSPGSPPCLFFFPLQKVSLHFFLLCRHSPSK